MWHGIQKYRFMRKNIVVQVVLIPGYGSKCYTSSTVRLTWSGQPGTWKSRVSLNSQWDYCSCRVDQRKRKTKFGHSFMMKTSSVCPLYVNSVLVEEAQSTEKISSSHLPLISPCATHHTWWCRIPSLSTSSCHHGAHHPSGSLSTMSFHRDHSHLEICQDFSQRHPNQHWGKGESVLLEDNYI